VLDIKRIFSLFRLPVEGVAHVGAHLAPEIDLYEEMGFSPILFVEANPGTFAEMSKRLEGRRAHKECIAISDRVGQTVFHQTNNGQSSSVLALKKHRQAHPGVVETGAITVDTITLDRLLEERYAGQRFSFLNMDIQGAELLALKGATRFLDTVAAINCEVNFDELYEGAPHIGVLDAFLSAFNFTRVETIALYHRSWGDAFYVKDQFTKV
jgi:FkbM family methyltransferase